MRELVGYGILTIAIIIVTLGISIGLIIPLNYYSCIAKWDGTFEVSYGFTQGCRINVDGKWIPENNYRQF